MDDRAAKRVALARDVISQLETMQIRPRFGAYLLPSSGGCLTCALGSMMVACCGVPKLDPPGRAIGSDPTLIIECLSPLFDLGELAAIEAAFEGQNCLPVANLAIRDMSDPLDSSEYNRLYDLLCESAKAFGAMDYAVSEDGDADEYESSARARAEAARRVRAIMANIIANDGDFCPEQL